MKEGVPQEETPVEAQESFVLPDLQPEEQIEEYMERVTLVREGYTGGIRLEKALNSQGKHKEDMTRALLKAVQESSAGKFTKEKGEQELEKLSAGITFASNEAKEDSAGSAHFEHTNRSRWFYGCAEGTDDTPYSQLLFGVHCDPELGDDLTLPYFKALLDDKKILMLGGGNSATDLIVGVCGDPAVDPVPSKIVNTDISFAGITDEPLVQEKIAEGSYVKAIAHADNPEEVHKVLSSNGIEGGMDEIWASYSVPFYLKTPEEIRGLFATVKNNLAPGGTARISPVSFQVSNDLLMNHPEEVDRLKATIMDSARELQEDPQFNVYVFRPAMRTTTLIIKRLKSTE